MKQEASILVVDDSDDDLLLMKMAYKQSGLVHPLHVVNGGVQAIAYLHGDGAFADRARYPMPSLLLLDLKMPIKSGFEVLAWVRSQPGLRRLPVIFLTSSEEPCDIIRAYDLGVNSYAVKPAAFIELLGLLKRLGNWWLEANRSPNLRNRNDVHECA